MQAILIAGALILSAITGWGASVVHDRIAEPIVGANSTISNLPSISSLDSNDLIPVVDTSAGQTKQITFSNATGSMSTYLGNTYSPIAGSASITTVGTVTSGTWNGSTLTVPYGGTASTTLAANRLFVGNGTGNLISIGGGTSGQFLTSNGPSSAPSFQTAAIDQAANYTWTGQHTFSSTTTFSGTSTFAVDPQGAVAVFGDGSDGDVTISSGTTTLTRDMYYRNLTINSGTAIVPNGYRIFVNKTLTNNGGISFNGNNGGNGGNGSAGSGGMGGSGGSSGAAATALNGGTVASTSAQVACPSSNGGNGGNTQAPGNNSGSVAGASGGSLSSSIGTNSNAGVTGGIGGSGGAGGGGGAQAGGSGGYVTGGSAGTILSPTRKFSVFPNFVNFYDATTTNTGNTYLIQYTGSPFVANSGGGSGGGGGGGGNSHAGRGGGGGGGCGGAGGTAGTIVIYSRTVVNNGHIRAIGGNGGNGGDGANGVATTDTGGAGGGGGTGSGGMGGSGGVIVLVYSSLTGSSNISVAGGSGGTRGANIGTGGGTSGSGSAGSNGSLGTNGGSGATGQIYYIPF